MPGFNSLYVAIVFALILCAVSDGNDDVSNTVTKLNEAIRNEQFDDALRMARTLEPKQIAKLQRQTYDSEKKGVTLLGLDEEETKWLPGVDRDRLKGFKTRRLYLLVHDDVINSDSEAKYREWAFEFTSKYNLYRTYFGELDGDLPQSKVEMEIVRKHLMIDKSTWDKTDLGVTLAVRKFFLDQISDDVLKKARLFRPPVAKSNR